MREIDTLLGALPWTLDDVDTENLLEVVVDIGRPLEFRYPDGIEQTEVVITREDLDACMKHLPKFGSNNRAGLDGTIHRISQILDRFNEPVGLTYRVGRTFEGCVQILKDLVDSGANVLLLGKPGIGKTSKLRDVARHLSVELQRRVVIVDTSNEIAGDGVIPHPAVGGARRMQVPVGKSQHAIMREAVENHMPQVIIVDEISDAQETEAARTIAQRGVQLIATAHGTQIWELLQNPPLAGLLGNVKSMPRTDEWAERHNNGRKSVLERQFPPIFDAVVELVAFDEVVVHTDLQEVVDTLLAGGEVRGERRRMINGGVKVIETKALRLPTPSPITVADRINTKKQRR
jgi:stage III sporulation protein SpoIIIAA